VFNKRVKKRFQFRLYRVRVGNALHFQLRVGLGDDMPSDFIPVHRSAFAKHLPLEESHPTAVDAHFELSGLLAWMEERLPG